MKPAKPYLGTSIAIVSVCISAVAPACSSSHISHSPNRNPFSQPEWLPTYALKTHWHFYLHSSNMVGLHHFLKLLIGCIFLQKFQVHSKTEQKVQSSQSPLPPTLTQPQPSSKSSRSSTFVTGNKPMLTYHYHPKFIVYTRVHSLHCTFYGFWPMYK